MMGRIGKMATLMTEGLSSQSFLSLCRDVNVAGILAPLKRVEWAGGSPSLVRYI